MTRLEQLRQRLASRTGADGKPIPGYEKNCEAIRAEIQRIERAEIGENHDQAKASDDHRPGNGAAVASRGSEHESG